LHNAELQNLYSSPDMMKSRRMRWADYVALMEEMRNAYKIFVENLKGGDHWKNCMWMGG